MNYRHSFHAGNFADVIKHIVLVRVLAHLRQKEKPFRVIDTHAGVGFYDLEGTEAARTGEWLEGIARLAQTRLSPAAENVLAPYRAALAALAPTGTCYPGSPALIQHMLRVQDHAAFNELHEATFHALRTALGRDRRIVTTAIDAYTAWKAQTPPPERRGCVIIDPPFEKEDEFTRMAEGLRLMAAKWASGTAILWYPIKNRHAVSRFEEQARMSGFGKLLLLELHVDADAADGPLSACGLMIANPPWTLADDMTRLLPELAACLARNETARWRVDWLDGP